MADREYAYYSGCSLEGTAVEYDISVRRVMEALGIRLSEPEDWSCCGSTPAHTVDHLLAAALAARNLTIIEKMGFNTVITPCPSCMMAFKKAHHRMKEDIRFKDEVNSLLDEPYNLNVQSKSALQIIIEDIGLEKVKERVTHVMPDLKVAPYYGCILNRPPEIAQFDDPENPLSMDKIFTAIGVEVCDFAFKVECCGAAYGVPKRDMVNELTYKILSMAVDCGANCVAVACPLCQQNLDLRQQQVNIRKNTSFNIPVLYFSQIMGLAYGYSPEEMVIDKLVVNPDSLISSRVTLSQWNEMKAREAEASKAKKKEKKNIEKIEEET